MARNLVLAAVTGTFKALVARIEHPRPMPLVLVIGLPGPVDISRGVAVKPPIMPGWDDFPIADTLHAEFGCPVLCENDVNLRALGEARAIAPDQSPLLYIKISTGIGGGLVTASGELYHGADGSAGDIGHVRVHGADEVLCACGNYGCVEAVAAAPAILSQLGRMTSPPGQVPATLEELMEALRVNEKMTVGLVREAAGQVGEVVANLVHFYNPARIVVGGGLTVPSDDMLAGIRAVVYRRALPLATRNLVISPPDPRRMVRHLRRTRPGDRARADPGRARCVPGPGPPPVRMAAGHRSSTCRMSPRPRATMSCPPESRSQPPAAVSQ